MAGQGKAWRGMVWQKYTNQKGGTMAWLERLFDLLVFGGGGELGWADYVRFALIALAVAAVCVMVLRGA